MKNFYKERTPFYKDSKKKIHIDIIYFSYMKIIFIITFLIFIKYIFLSKNKKKKNFSKDIKYFYDEIGEKIFIKNKTLNFTQLDQDFYGINKNNSNFNHIHILFAFNNNYYLLASITITSILKTANPNNFIHIHIIAVRGFKFKNMKKLNSLKTKLNNNSEFIFYDGSKAEKDFGYHIKKEAYGVGEYAKFLGPLLVNKNIDRIITLDSGDLLIKKDLLELYNYPIDNFLVRGIPDPLALCFIKTNIFYSKKGYINGGVFLYNLKKWREMDIYNDIIKLYHHLNFKGKLPTAHQDIINSFLPSATIGLLPFKYNFQEFIDLNRNDRQRGSNIYMKKCSYYYGKKKEVFESEKNIVIRHYNKYKIYFGKGINIMKREWNKYAKLTGFYKEICMKYPKGCQKLHITKK